MLQKKLHRNRKSSIVTRKVSMRQEELQNYRKGSIVTRRAPELHEKFKCNSKNLYLWKRFHSNKKRSIGHSHRESSKVIEKTP